MNKRTILYIITMSFFVAALASFFASSNPDGLEKVAETLGFIGSEKGTFGIFSDYTLLTGLIGVLLTYGIFKTVSLLVKRNN